MRHSHHSSRSSTPCQRCVYGPLELEWAPQADSLLPQRKPGQRVTLMFDITTEGKQGCHMETFFFIAITSYVSELNKQRL